jgi:hypothetical protein
MIGAVEAESILAPGEIVDGRYVIERLIGRGGFAEVYRATDAQSDRAFALKLMRPSSHKDVRRRAGTSCAANS